MDSARLRELADTLVRETPRPLRERAVGSMHDASAMQDWFYAPRQEPGVLLRELGTDHLAIVHMMLGLALGAGTYQRAVLTMAFESILRNQDHGDTRRDAGLYAIRFFEGRDMWAWRFQGHHISINLAFDDALVVSGTPFFLGANPAVVRVGGVPLAAPLADVEAAGLDVIAALRPKDVVSASLPQGPPPEIVYGVGRGTVGETEFKGIRVSDSAGRSISRFAELLTLIDNLTPGPAFLTSDDDDEGDGAWAFAWAGAVGSEGPHYFRAVSRDRIVEYHNVQDDGRHAHLVVRHLGHDLGHGPTVAESASRVRSIAPQGSSEIVTTVALVPGSLG